MNRQRSMVSSSSSPRRGFLVLLILLVLIGACQSETTSNQQREPLPEGELAIEDPWVRPAAAGDTARLYMTIANGRSNADTLVGARRAPLYQDVQIFGPDTSGMDGVQPVDSLIIRPQRRVHLAPDSAYVALNSLSQPLNEGETVLVTLDFAQGGLQQVRASIRKNPPSDGQ